MKPVQENGISHFSGWQLSRFRKSGGSICCYPFVMVKAE